MNPQSPNMTPTGSAGVISPYLKARRSFASHQQANKRQAWWANKGLDVSPSAGKILKVKGLLCYKHTNSGTFEIRKIQMGLWSNGSCGVLSCLCGSAGASSNKQRQKEQEKILDLLRSIFKQHVCLCAVQMHVENPRWTYKICHDPTA